jgi:hypothetical protein
MVIEAVLSQIDPLNVRAVFYGLSNLETKL